MVGAVHEGAPPPSFPSMTRPPRQRRPLLELHGISKSFGSVQALTDVEFEVRPGEVMALVGDNGAGKSTLIKCVAGIHSPDSGQVLFDGNEVHIHGPKDAAKLGIEVVYQDLALCDNLDVVQNMYLGREAHDWLQRLKEPVMEAKTAETMKSLAVTTIRSIRQPVATLSGGQRQSVAVARAVMWNSRLVILDEPTAALGVAQTQQVLELVERLADQGLAVVLISHNLHDIFAVADRITVLRLGRNVAIYERDETTQQEVVAGDHGRRADEGGRDPVDGTGAGARMSVDATRRPAPAAVPESFFGRVRDNIRGGNLGSWPVLIGLAVIVIFFSFKADNFLSPGNFSNIITQMAGTTLLAYGVVFVLLIGEIDLSISYISGIAGVVVAQADHSGRAIRSRVIVAILLAVAACALIGAFQGSFVAFIGVPAFVVTLAGYQIWQGVIQKSIEDEGVIVIQDSTVNNTANYFFSEKAGWILAAIVLRHLHRQRRERRSSPTGVTASPCATRGSSSRRSVAVVAVAVVVVVVSNRDRGVPFVLRPDDRVAARPDVRRQADDLRPARLCGRRQRRGGPARGHQRGTRPR